MISPSIKGRFKEAVIFEHSIGYGNVTTEISPIQFSHSIEPGQETQPHELNQEQFLSLSDAQSLHTLVEQGKALEISIQPELENLTQLQSQGHEGYLNITLPMVGITDYLNSELGNGASHAFGSVLGLNQFSADSAQPHLSRPDFIVAKDIIGNQYEILLDSNGKVMVPEDGIGKFSLLSEVKLMYGLDQVLEGRGLASNTESGNLYLLPPPGFHGKYTPTLSVSQTQDDFSEKTISERKLPILLQEANAEPGVQKIEINAHNLGIDPLSHKFSDLGWQHGEKPGMIEKHFGLSDSGLHNLSKYLFTELDFTKAIVSGDHFGLKQVNGLNDFALSPEATGVYYDLWLNGVVTHQISPDNFLSRINPQELLSIQNLDDLGLSPAEQLSMQAILTQAKLGDFSGLQHLYEPSFNHLDNLHQHVAAELGVDSVDNHAISVHTAGEHYADLLDHTSIQGQISPAHSSQADYLTGKTIALNFDDVFAPGEHGAMISGFNVNHDKLDLSHVLNQLPGLQIENLSANLHGHDVQINYQDPHTGQVQTLATLVSAAPDSHTLPDLSHYLNWHNQG